MTEEQQPGAGRAGSPQQEPQGARARSAGIGPRQDGAAGAARGPWVSDWRETIGGTEEPSGRLRRSREHKLVGGVCGGLGEYFDVDPIVFRVPLAVVCFVGGLGFVFYGVAWLLLPAKGEVQNPVRGLLSGRVELASLSALVIAFVGCGLFLTTLGSRNTLSSLAVAGAVLGGALWSRNRRAAEEKGAQRPTDPSVAQAVAEAPPETTAPPSRSTPAWWREGARAEPEPGYLWGPPEWAPPGWEPAPMERPQPAEEEAAPSAPPEAASARPRSPSIGGLVQFAALLAAVGGAFSVWGERPLGTALAVGLGCAIAVLGIGLVLSAFLGRVGGGTVCVLLLAAALLAGAAVVPKEITTEWTEGSWRPQSVSQVRTEYRVGSGEAGLDLGDLRLGKDETVSTRVRAGAGSIRVQVPDQATVQVALHAGIGELRWPESTDGAGEIVHGNSGGIHQDRHLTLHPYEGAPARGTVRLDLTTHIGQIEVVRDTEQARQAAHRAGARPSGSRPGAGEAVQPALAAQRMECTGMEEVC